MLYLIANWKMNPPSIAEAQKLASSIKPQKNVETVLCPPFVYLDAVRKKLKRGVKLGAQNCHFESSGAYTGEVSPAMLKDLNCDFVILGHSERRKHFKEDSSLINKKLKKALALMLTPVLAVGEKEGESVNVAARQLKDALLGISAAKAKNIIVAYEPIWAIGTGNPASANDAMSARILIRKVLADLYSKNTAEKIPVIYGGSTDALNIKIFVQEAQMDGALVGGSSLNSKEFLKMINEIA